MIGSYQLGDLMAFARPYYGVNKQTGQPRKLVIKPQIYVVNFGDLAASAQYVRMLQVQANADFILLGFYAENSDGTSMSGVKVLVTDNSSGENFTNGTTYLWNFMRTNSAVESDVTLPYPRMVYGNSSLSIALTLNATPQNDVVISALGVHIYALD